MSAISGVNSLRARLSSPRTSVAQTAARMRSLGVAGMAADARSMAAAGMARPTRAGWRVLGAGIRDVGAAFKIAFGPMSLLLTALSFGVDYVIENWDKIVPYFTTLWGGVKSIFEKVKGWMQPAPDMVGGAIEKVSAIWDWAFGDNDFPTARKPYHTTYRRFSPARRATRT